MEGRSATAIFMLDTTAVSQALRNPQGAVAARFGETLPGQVVTSAIAVGELRHIVAKAGARALEVRLDQFLDYVPIMSVGASVAATYGSVRAQLAEKGSLIGANDLCIAAHALDLGVAVVTDNTREFARVPGLMVENWQR
ncbi:MAG: PIN domain-containing protein [Bifidobacteriaceae bacterium]|jgi:tRNA(fMet)-specific endonuclease VapC|nr:PIN domain-containing protein [Bifidobacteriaceae bacterium]